MGQHAHLSECHHYGRSEFLHAVVAKASCRGVERGSKEPALDTTFFSGQYLIARINIRALRCPPAKSGEFILDGNYIDAEKWSPLIYNFRHYYRLADKKLGKTFRAER